VTFTYNRRCDGGGGEAVAPLFLIVLAQETKRFPKKKDHMAKIQPQNKHVTKERRNKYRKQGVTNAKGGCGGANPRKWQVWSQGCELAWVRGHGDGSRMASEHGHEHPCI